MNNTVGVHAEQATGMASRFHMMRVRMCRSRRHHENQENTGAHYNEELISSPVL